MFSWIALEEDGRIFCAALIQVQRMVDVVGSSSKEDHVRRLDDFGRGPQVAGIGLRAVGAGAIGRHE